MNFVSSNRAVSQAGMWETNTLAASFHARLNVALTGYFQQTSVNPAFPAATNCHKFRSTLAGFWFRASNVPASPIDM